MINNNDNNALISREELLAALDSEQQLRQSNYDEALARSNESDVATCRAEAQRIAEIKVVRNIIAALPAIPLDAKVKEMIETLDWWLALPDSAVDMQGSRNLVAQLRDDLLALPAIPLDAKVKEMIETLDWWLALPDSAVDMQGSRNLVAQLRDDLLALPAIPLDDEELLYQGIEAMRLTREYVNAATLPAVEGWSWFDFVVKAQAVLGLTNEWWNDPAHTGDSQHVSDELPTGPRPALPKHEFILAPVETPDDVLSDEKPLDYAPNFRAPVEPVPAPDKRNLDDLHWAWTIICNAGGGDWLNEGREWREAAETFRTRYHQILRNESAPVPAPRLECSIGKFHTDLRSEREDNFCYECGTSLSPPVGTQE